MQAVGLVKNLALMSYITVGSPSAPLLEFLDEWTTEPLDEVAPGVIPKVGLVGLADCVAYPDQMFCMLFSPMLMMECMNFSSCGLSLLRVL
jgi:hypothetical protein